MVSASAIAWSGVPPSVSNTSSWPVSRSPWVWSQTVTPRARSLTGPRISGRLFLTPSAKAAVDPVRSTVMPISTTGVTFGLAAGLTVKLGEDAAAGRGAAVVPHAGHLPSSPGGTNLWHPLQIVSLITLSSVRPNEAGAGVFR